MPAPSQRSFTFGEVAPTHYARADAALYAAGLRTARNVVITKSGGLESRPGTTYKGTAKSATAANVTRTVDCVFSTTQRYVLEFGNLYVRFWLDGAQVTVSGVVAWADATPYTIGVTKSYSGVNYVCILAHTSVLADNRPSTGSFWQTYWYALTGTIYEWPTPYVTADLFRVQRRHPDASSVVFVHPTYAPKLLTRISATVWSFVTATFESDMGMPTNLAVSGTAGSGWGYAVTAVDITGVESAVTSVVRTNLAVTDAFSLAAVLAANPRTVTWDAVTGAVKYYIFANKDASTVLALQIGEVLTNSFVDSGQYLFTAIARFPPTASGLFGSTDNYPGAVAVHQQRLLLAGTNNRPDTVYASRSADALNFSVRSPIEDDDMMSYRQIGPRTNRVLHMLAVAQRLVSFDEVGEWIIRGDTDSILRPGEVNPMQVSGNGASANLAPILANDVALYVQARGNVVRDFLPDGSGSDRSLTAQHLLKRRTVVDWCYQQTPHSVLWMVLDDGTMLSLTYQRETGVYGWARHDFVAASGAVESVCCVPEGTEDAVYLMVRRTVNAAAVRWIERLADRTAAWPATICMDAAVVAVEA